MQSLAEIRQALESHGLRPNKALGQNFLIEPAHAARLVEMSGVGSGDLVLEVGPGTGVLTDLLLERGCSVIACELDRGLAALVRERYAAAARFVLIEGDCLASKHEVHPAVVEALAGRPFRLVANLPYGAASPLMIALATRFHPALRPPAACLGQWVTIQREVADRLRATPGTRDYGEMGVLVQAACEVRRIAVLPPGCFWPSPKVDSEMVAIRPRSTPIARDLQALARLSRMLFTQRRKQIGTTLARAAPRLLEMLPPGVTPTMRAEHMSIEQLAAMSERLE